MVPQEPAVEIQNMDKYRKQFNSCMLCDYAKMESEDGSRTVSENAHFIAVCPHWAIWPYETLIIAKTHMPSLIQATDDHLSSLAEIVSKVTCKYDNLFQVSFPYSMGLHQAPLRGTEEEISACCLHIHFYPPLLRSATVRKFLVG